MVEPTDRSIWSFHFYGAILLKPLTSLIEVMDTMGIIPLRGMELKDLVTIGTIADRNICPSTNKDLHFPSSNVSFP